jgi:hypothetical protein
VPGVFTFQNVSCSSIERNRRMEKVGPDIGGIDVKRAEMVFLRFIAVPTIRCDLTQKNK